MQFTCEVPRFKGNVTIDNLTAYRGESVSYKSTITNNHDGTQRLSIKESLHLTPELNNTQIRCTFRDRNDGIQVETYIIMLSKYRNKGKTTEKQLSTFETLCYN